MTTVLIGSTGFVGRTLHEQLTFDLEVHRPNVTSLCGAEIDLLVCAGLPAAKWLANREPLDDFTNMAALAAVLDTLTVDRFVLISTIDVYPACAGVSECDVPPLDNPQGYGRNRAWFERFIHSRFPRSLTLRLPALYGMHLRKNLVFDLLEHRHEQISGVHADSTFQFWDVAQTWSLVERALDEEIPVVNVATEPTTAQEVADVFDVRLGTAGTPVHYDMHTRHGLALAGREGPYLRTSAETLLGISALRDAWGRSG